MAEHKKDRLINRELSWIEFNSRVLAEAMDPSNPLLERVKFTGIVSSNFDEFFMVRLPSIESEEVLKQVRHKAYELIAKQDQFFTSILIPELEAAGITRVPKQLLNDKQIEYVKSLFQKEIFPILTPIALSEEQPTPVLVNQSLYMMVVLQRPGRPKHYAVVEIPKNLPRMITLPTEKGYPFLLLEDVVSFYAQDLFSGYEILEKGLMRLTRAAEMTLDEETDEDFAQVVANALRGQRHNDIVRLEISASPEMKEFLKKKVDIEEDVFFEIKSWFDLKGISQLAFQPSFEELKRPAWLPRPIPDFEEADDIWDVLRRKDIYAIHPYESFSAVVRLVSEAANDPDVLAIKQTLYRAGQNSAIVAALERAAEKGKRVTVLIELKARFDEENNIEWARRLQNAGATVIYGVTGFKTHAKACMIVRREPDGIKRYLHLSTGNYNDKTAHIYSDVGLFTSHEDLANDITAFFNMITGYSQPTALSKIVVAPFGLRKKIKQLITREMLRSTPQQPGLILAKMNSLVDAEIIEMLYKASQAGVQIKLNVRGICCLRPGVKGMSENIEVTSVIDMFLEHSRMIYFANGGDTELYLSSADWMPRNLDRRIEILFPVESAEVKKELVDILKAYFKDNMKSWRLLPDGDYQKIQTTEKKFRVQEWLIKKVLDREQQDKQGPPELKPQKPRIS
jgi:polyphosphate kinase